MNAPQTRTFFSDQSAKKIGHVVAISGTHVKATIFANGDMPLTVGSFVILQSGMKAQLGILIKIDMMDNRDFLATILLKGEIINNPNGKMNFKRGISSPIMIRADIIPATEEDLLSLFSDVDEPYVRLGQISKTKNVPANILINRLLGGNFGIFGNRGSGKSTMVSLLMHKLMEAMPQAHCILFDPHGEYEAAFNGNANIIDIIDQQNFFLPYWLLNAEETSRIFLDPQSPTLSVEEEVLNDIVVGARHRFFGQTDHGTSRITVDSPVPYRMSDLIQILDERLGSLNESIKVSVLRRMRQRILAVRSDARYKFLFPRMGHSQDLRDILTNLLRIPVAGKPITLINTSGMVLEVSQVVVSTISRLVFDFLQWSRDLNMPVLLVMDEAHRYLGESKNRFSQKTQSLWEQMAMEGRKFGISLGIITQIPSSLPPALISQLGTVMIKKINSEAEISFLARYAGDLSLEVSQVLNGFSPDEVYIAGDGVRNAMTISCDALSDNKKPRSKGVEFSDSWSRDSVSFAEVDAGLNRWCDYKPE
jgi:DNA helicase HerA-like ATPase